MVAPRTARGTAINENQSQILLPPSCRSRNLGLDDGSALPALEDLSELPDLPGLGAVLMMITPLLLVHKVHRMFAKQKSAK
jgi:hypothetical protein